MKILKMPNIMASEKLLQGVILWVGLYKLVVPYFIHSCIILSNDGVVVNS